MGLSERLTWSRKSVSFRFSYDSKIKGLKLLLCLYVNEWKCIYISVLYLKYVKHIIRYDLISWIEKSTLKLLCVCPSVKVNLQQLKVTRRHPIEE